MEDPKMKKVPSALKWLAEQRARTAGELRSANVACQSLLDDVHEVQQELAAMEKLLLIAQERRDLVTERLTALDKVVTIYDADIDPALIAPINGWQGAYGKRGALRAFLVETLKAKSPAYIATKELEKLTIAVFGLVFEHNDIQQHWYRGSFRNTLKVLAAQGIIERGPGNIAGAYTPGKWRWKQEKPKTLAELRE